MARYEGRAALPIVETCLSRVQSNIELMLGRYEPASHLAAMFDALRGIEELVNIVLAEDWNAKDKTAFARLPLVYGDASAMIAAGAILSRNFSADVTKRVRRTIALLQDYAELTELTDGPPVKEQLGTVLEAAVYLQGRRRMLVATLYLIPTICSGSATLGPLLGLSHLLELADKQWQFAVNMHRERLLAYLFPDYVLTDNGGIFSSNRDYQPLDWQALEPERVSATETLNPDLPAFLAESLPQGHVFSAEELRNQIEYTKRSFEEFALASTEFTELMGVLKWSLQFCEDGYLISLPLDELVGQLKELPTPGRARTQLIRESGAGVFDCLNAYNPFVRVGSNVVSCLPLMTRFMNHSRNSILNRNKRYQIRSGFIFEENVKKELARMGLGVEPTKRINRQEFDVIARCGDILINIQCKNNEVDLTRLESNAQLFARYIARLNLYYGRALSKEENREHLLRSSYKPSRIAHFVLTKTATPHDNPRVLSFAEIGQLPERAVQLSA